MRKILAALMLAYVTFMPMVASALSNSDVSSTILCAETWNEMNDTQKLWFTKGVLDGFAMGYITGWGLGSYKAVDYDNATFSHTVEFFKAELDDYYSLHPASTKSPGGLMQCFADKPMHRNVFCKNIEE
jgi:nitric oxide reductase large subunit